MKRRDMVPRAQRNRPSHIYIDRSYLREDDELRQHAENACFTILKEEYFTLPPLVQRKFDKVAADILRERQVYRKWAPLFRQAYWMNQPLPTVSLGRTIAVDTSTLKGLEDLTSTPRAYFEILRAGRHGVTSLEARLFGEKGGGISGALSKLHQHDIIACLTATR